MIFEKTEIYIDPPPQIPWGQIRSVSLGWKIKDWEVVYRTYNLNKTTPRVVLFNKKLKVYFIKEACRVKKIKESFLINLENYISLPGQRFGRLTILQDSGKRNISKSVLWKCQCDCGNITYATIDELKKGTRISCGCIRRDSCAINLLGKKFGLLTVTERVYDSTACAPSSNHARWKCLCDCGNEIITLSQSLLTGKTTSCGCSRRTNIANQKFGKLTAIKYSYSVNGQTYWLCQCDCGNQKIISKKHLIDGTTISCGCSNESMGEIKVHQLLKDLKLNFIQEYSLCKNPKTQYMLWVDFYLPDYNCCIEYDGIQHFKENNWNHDTLLERQKRDNIKNQYCKDNNIYLIRIPYTDYNILDDEYIMERLNNLEKYDYNKQN